MRDFFLVLTGMAVLFALIGAWVSWQWGTDREEDTDD